MVKSGLAAEQLVPHLTDQNCSQSLTAETSVRPSGRATHVFNQKNTAGKGWKLIETYVKPVESSCPKNSRLYAQLVLHICAK